MGIHGSGMVGLVLALACSTFVIASSAITTNTTLSLREEKRLSYTHTWPDMKFGWRIVVGTMITFSGAACGSVGGGAAGTFIPMLTLIIGFDAKSATAISKCMIMGVATSTFYYNVRRRHPTIDMPIIDYDLALLFQPMLVLGISIGVMLNVILPSLIITFMLVVLCIVTSIMSYFKGIKKWKQETIQKEVENDISSANGSYNQSLLCDPKKQEKVSIIQNVDWKKMNIIVWVWIVILALQIIKSFTTDYSTIYWILNFLQVPVVVASSGYEAVKLYQGKSIIASRGEDGTDFKATQLVFYCVMGVVAGTIGGTVGLGGASMLGPIFLQMGVPPQVTSATATFAVLFSSSMSAVEYYLLHRFPIPYTLYFTGVSTVAALMGQHIVKKLISKLGRESPIIFIIAFTYFISALFLGKFNLFYQLSVFKVIIFILFLIIHPII